MRLTKEQYKELMRRQPAPVTFFNRVSFVEVSDKNEFNRITNAVNNKPLDIVQLRQKVVETYVGE